MAGRAASGIVTKYPGIQVQSSSLGVNIPVGWGTHRCRCNLVDYLDFAAKAQNDAGGGKGGSQVSGYTYSATIIVGIEEGPIDDITQVWQNGNTFAHGSNGSGQPDTGTGSATTQAGLSFAHGAIGQAPWSYLLSAHPTHAIGYSGLAIAFQENAPLDSSASTPNYSFEIVRTTGFAVDGGYTGPDIDPSKMLADFFENTRTGVPRWPVGLLDSISLTSAASSLQKYTVASGLLLSPVIDQQRSAQDFLTEVFLALNCTCVWSEGLLKFIPYGDTAATGNGQTYTPNLTPVYSLSDDDYEMTDGQNTPPLLIDIEDQSAAYNEVQFEYLDRTNQYNMSIAFASDAANVEEFSARRKDPDTVHVICTPTVAAISAQLWLQRTLYVRAQYKFNLSWAYALLEPGDIVELTDVGLGLNAYPVRIIEIDEDESSILSIVAEDLLVGVSHAPLYSMATGAGTQINQNVAAPPVEGTVGPIFLNPPTALTPSGVELWAAVAGSGANWGGCFVWVSFDAGSTYQNIGEILGGARYGVLTATFASGSDPDTANTCSVDLSSSGGSLVSAADAVADASGSLSIVDSELISFSTATLTGANAYNLTTYLRRGVLNTSIASHASGAKFVRLDDGMFKFPYLATQAGQSVMVKFQSFNPWGRGIQDLSTCVAYTTTPIPVGARPPASSAWVATATVITNGGQSTPALLITGKSDNPSASAVIFYYRPTGTAAWASDGQHSIATTQDIIAPVQAMQTYDVAVAYVVNGIEGQKQIITGSGTSTGGGGSGGAPGTALLNDGVLGVSKTFPVPSTFTGSHGDLILTASAGSGSGTGSKSGFTDSGGGGANAVVVKDFPMVAGDVFTYTLAAVGTDCTVTKTGLSLVAHPGTNASGAIHGAGGPNTGSQTATGAASVTSYAGRDGGLTDTWDGGGPGATVDIPSGTVTTPGPDNVTDNSAGAIPGQGGSGSVFYGAQLGGGCNFTIIARA